MNQALFDKALENGKSANEGYRRCRAYLDALLLAFSHLGNYRNYDCESGSADGFADAIEGCLNLYNRMYSGEELAEGLPVKLTPWELLRIEVSELETLQPY